MNAVVRELAARYPRLLVLDVEADAEEVADVAESFEVVSVPTFVVLRVSLFYPAFLFRTLCVCASKMREDTDEFFFYFFLFRSMLF